MTDNEADAIFYDCESDLIKEMGFNVFTDFVKEFLDTGCNLVDMNEVIDYIKRKHGRGSLASYDNIEHKEGEYYIYRTN